jgi:hypothetical protein
MAEPLKLLELKEFRLREEPNLSRAAVSETACNCETKSGGKSTPHLK